MIVAGVILLLLGYLLRELEDRLIEGDSFDS